MKKLIIIGLLSIVTCGVFAQQGMAGLCKWLRWRRCHSCFSTTIRMRQYNAFTPVCWGNLMCDGCCPVMMGGGYPPMHRPQPWFNPHCGPSNYCPTNCCPEPSCCTSGCCDAGCLPSNGGHYAGHPAPFHFAPGAQAPAGSAPTLPAAPSQPSAPPTPDSPQFTPPAPTPLPAMGQNQMNPEVMRLYMAYLQQMMMMNRFQHVGYNQGYYQPAYYRGYTQPYYNPQAYGYQNYRQPAQYNPQAYGYQNYGQQAYNPGLMQGYAPQNYYGYYGAPQAQRR